MVKSDRDPEPRVDIVAILKAGLSVSCLLLPVAVIQQIVRPTGAALALFYAAYLFLAAVAGFGGAKLAPARPLPNGVGAAVVGYAVVQIIGVVRRTANHEELRPLAYIYLALLMATCGMAGAMLERRTRSARQ